MSNGSLSDWAALAAICGLLLVFVVSATAHNMALAIWRWWFELVYRVVGHLSRARRPPLRRRFSEYEEWHLLNDTPEEIIAKARADQEAAWNRARDGVTASGMLTLNEATQAMATALAQAGFSLSAAAKLTHANAASIARARTVSDPPTTPPRIPDRGTR